VPCRRQERLERRLDEVHIQVHASVPHEAGLACDFGAGLTAEDDAGARDFEFAAGELPLEMLEAEFRQKVERNRAVNECALEGAPGAEFGVSPQSSHGLRLFVRFRRRPHKVEAAGETNVIERDDVRLGTDAEAESAAAAALALGRTRHPCGRTGRHRGALWIQLQAAPVDAQHRDPPFVGGPR
jgi:hypothetical protein